MCEFVLLLYLYWTWLCINDMRSMLFIFALFCPDWWWRDWKKFRWFRIFKGLLLLYIFKVSLHYIGNIKWCMSINWDIKTLGAVEQERSYWEITGQKPNRKPTGNPIIPAYIQSSSNCQDRYSIPQLKPVMHLIYMSYIVQELMYDPPHESQLSGHCI